LKKEMYLKEPFLGGGGESLEIESIKKVYAAYSNVYDVLFKRFFYPRIRNAITTMDIRPGELVLDVGVGTGLSFSVFPKDCKVVGIDLSREMLKKAKKKIDENRLENINVLSMDAMSIGFADNTFDKVFLSHVVTVVPDPYRMMQEVKRVCKKDGVVVVVNHFKSKNPLIELCEKWMNPLCKKIGWRSDLSLNEFVRNAGLKVTRQYMLKKIDFWHIVFATNEK